jgi:hypothetical protein
LGPGRTKTGQNVKRKKTAKWFLKWWFDRFDRFINGIGFYYIALCWQMFTIGFRFSLKRSLQKK